MPPVEQEVVFSVVLLLTLISAVNNTKRAALKRSTPAKRPNRLNGSTPTPKYVIHAADTARRSLAAIILHAPVEMVDAAQNGVGCVGLNIRISGDLGILLMQEAVHIIPSLDVRFGFHECMIIVC